MLSSFRKPQTVRRYSGGYYDNDGMWHDGSYEEISILASVQPINQNEQSQYTDMLPEGGTVFNGVKIYSDQPLLTEKQALRDGSPLQEADRLVWRGRVWKVIQCEEWQSDVINHYRMVAWEEEPKEPEEEKPNETGN